LIQRKLLQAWHLEASKGVGKKDKKNKKTKCTEMYYKPLMQHAHVN